MTIPKDIKLDKCGVYGSYLIFYRSIGFRLDRNLGEPISFKKKIKDKIQGQAWSPVVYFAPPDVGWRAKRFGINVEALERELNRKGNPRPNDSLIKFIPLDKEGQKILDSFQEGKYYSIYLKIGVNKDNFFSRSALWTKSKEKNSKTVHLKNQKKFYRWK